MSYKVYSKKRDYSYTWGAFPTFELIDHRPDLLQRVLLHSSTDEGIRTEIKRRVPEQLILENDALLEKLANRENVYVLGVFRTSETSVQSGNHIVLHEPANFGNLGTIMRTALGLGYHDIVLIGPACDVFHPQTIRASMGALFSLRIEHFADFESYLRRFPEQTCYAFMGGSSQEITQVPHVKAPFSLLFGNESRGLPQSVSDFSTPVSIAMSEQVDSYNITIAAAIGMYVFYQKKAE